jgi:hypothetical protein
VTVGPDYEYEWVGALALSALRSGRDTRRGGRGVDEGGELVVLTLALVVAATETFERRDVG